MSELHDKRPNILWLCTDQQRFDTIHRLRNNWIITPNLDRLVNEGVSLNSAYAQNPVCTPSRASFLTGRYPRTTGVMQNGNEFFPRDEIPVTKILADNGYDCGLVGKLHLSRCEGSREKRTDDGYSFFKWSHQPQDDLPANDYQKWLKEKGIHWNKAYKGNKLKTKDIFTEGGIEARFHQTTWCAEESIDFIQNAQAPWLLSINFFDPHPPFDAPKEYKSHYNPRNIKVPKWKEGELDNKPPFQLKDFLIGGQNGKGPCFSKLSDLEKKTLIADYYAAIELIDEQMGRIIKALEQTGQKDNTVIIFQSDHGEMLGDHGLYWKGAYFYEELIHVPLIFSCPSRFKGGVQSRALVELVDIAPTVLELANMEVPYYMQGKSFLPVLKNEKNTHKDSIYCEYYNSLLNVHDVYATMYFDGRYKIVVFHGEEYGELYDHEKDPEEYNNLWFNEEYSNLKMKLLKKDFDRSVMTLDPRPRRIGYY